ncbi:MAG: 50S ribosomal protein L9 [Candidatus Portnoybacteria bacterium]
MKVILLQNIERVGKKGDIKDIPKGYARNFLIPRNLATLATEPELEKLEEQKELEAQQAEEELILYQELAEQMEGLELEISVKASEDDKLFGAVTSATISEKLKEKGFNVDKSQIKLENPIKEIGERDILIEFPHNLEVGIKIIISEKESEKKKE